MNLPVVSLFLTHKIVKKRVIKPQGFGVVHHTAVDRLNSRDLKEGISEQ